MADMSRSVISNERVCFICKTPYNLHRHHIFAGARRDASERLGAWVYLCARHHNMSSMGVHNSHDLDSKIKAFAQTKLEENGMSRSEFIATFGRNWRSDG